MTTGVITGVSHHHEQELVTAIEGASGVAVVRRCADVAELMSTGASGLADVAVVSADFRGLDRDSLRHLAGHGVRVAGLVAAGDDAAEVRLRQLGVSTLIRPGTEPDDIAEVLVGLAEGGTTSGLLPGAGSPARRDGGAATVPHDELARLIGGASTVPGRHDDVSGPGARNGPTRASSAPGAGGDADGAAAPQRARITAVWGPSGAPGRTTVAVTLASVFAGRGVRTLLVDLDTWGRASRRRSPSSTRHPAWRRRPGHPSRGPSTPPHSRAWHPR